MPTPFLRLNDTTSETLNRNFARIDAAFLAKSLAAPLPSTPIDPLGSTPTLGLARTSNPSLNQSFEVIDTLFALQNPTRRIQFTGTAVINENLAKIVTAAYAAAFPIISPFLLPLLPLLILTPAEDAAPEKEPSTACATAPERP